MDFIKEFWKFVKARRNYWLLPIVIILALFGFIMVIGEGSAVAPFIYAIW